MKKTLAQDMAIPFSRVVRIDEVPDKGVRKSIRANASEREAVASALDVLRIEYMSAEFELRPAGLHRIKLQGRVLAKAAQNCVVTLEPVDAEIDEQLEMEFWPEKEVTDLEKQADARMASIPLDGPEPVSNGVIDLGHLAYEHLASALDPYPRKEGAAFHWREGDEDEGDSNPFSVLAQLKE